MNYPSSRALPPQYAWAHTQAATKKATSFIKKLVWLYIIFLLIEGALRKWVLPGLSDLLLLIRDPLVLLIYMSAMAKGRFPTNGFVGTLIGLAILAFLCALCAVEVHPIILAYGLRANFLHIPLIFVMADVLEREDVEKIGTFFLWFSVAMTALIIYQFHSPIEARINWMPGGQVGGIIGARGHFRPAGTFSFVTGIASFYPIVTAFLLQQFIGKSRFHLLLLTLFAAAVVSAIPFSISRQNALTCGLVVAFSIPAALWAGSNKRYISRLTLGGIAIAVLLSIGPLFSEGLSTFTERWNSSTGEEQGGVKVALIDRYLESITAPFSIDVPFFGWGLGMGSNAGAKLLTGNVGFLMDEGEWARIILEMGTLMGWLFICYRVSLVFYLWTVSSRASKRYRDPLPLLLFGACLPLVFNGQWNPPTILGFSVISAGLCLAASKKPSLINGTAPHAPAIKNPARRQFYR